MSRNSEASTPDGHHQVFELLIETEGRSDESREALLDASDSGVAREVRHLLDQIDRRASSDGPPPSVAEVGGTIGGYRLVALLGAGGMGQVFLAEHDEPTRRVAIKVLRHRVVPDRLRQRFLREQKAMEQLSHRHVGRLLDAGTTADGEPYLVMEAIDGVRITAYCDANCLSIDDRLRLFLHVCKGTAHAHRRHLLHRDIKPSNVLVTETGGRPMAKLIDFGLAKALDSSVETGISATGVVGTPTHMSPEALHGDTTLDARTDVFSLGVLLHVLLTGRLPWVEPESTPRNPFTAMFHRRSSPPSDQLGRLDVDALDALAELRGTSRRRLLRRLRGDLDAIVQRAIDGDPALRYPTVDTLRADIERHLEHKPIRARRSWGPGYLLAKTTRRRLATVRRLLGKWTRRVRRAAPGSGRRR